MKVSLSSATCAVAALWLRTKYRPPGPSMIDGNDYGDLCRANAARLALQLSKSGRRRSGQMPIRIIDRTLATWFGSLTAPQYFFAPALVQDAIKQCRKATTGKVGRPPLSLTMTEDNDSRPYGLDVRTRERRKQRRNNMLAWADWFERMDRVGASMLTFDDPPPKYIGPRRKTKCREEK